MKKLITKAVAEIVDTSDDTEAKSGSFEAILSAPTKDRDGDTLKSNEWKQPLPEHIVIDMDHTMSVAGTVGSAKPFIDDDGAMRVKGTFASTAKGQEVRTLVNEGHIKTLSVAFLSEESGQKDADGNSIIERELLNGAFVAIPSNRESVVLSSKAFDVLSKAVADADADDENPGDAPEGSPKHDDMVQAIHDASVHLGAECVGHAAPDPDAHRVPKAKPAADDDDEKKSDPKKEFSLEDFAAALESVTKADKGDGKKKPPPWVKDDDEDDDETDGPKKDPKKADESPDSSKEDPDKDPAPGDKPAAASGSASDDDDSADKPAPKKKPAKSATPDDQLKELAARLFVSNSKIPEGE